jgi:hypothetical protein
VAVLVAGDDGFFVAKKDAHSVLRRNTAVGTGDDGFDIRGVSTRLARNRALRNPDLGIGAVRTRDRRRGERGAWRRRSSRVPERRLQPTARQKSALQWLRGDLSSR